MSVTTTPSHGFGSGLQTSVSLAHTSDANPLYVVFSWFLGSGALEGNLVTAITYDGVPVPLGGFVATQGNMMGWARLAAPPVGTANVVVTLSSARRLAVAAVNLSGWPDAIGDHAFAAHANHTDDEQPTVTVLSITGAEVLYWLGFNDPNSDVTAGGGLSELWNDELLGGGTRPNGDQVSAGGTATSSGASKTLSYSMAGPGEYWGFAALSYGTEGLECQVSLEDLENPCTIKEPIIWGAFQRASDDSVQLFADRPLRDHASGGFGGFKSPRLIESAVATRAASDWFHGSPPSQSVLVKLADQDRHLRSLLSSSDPDFIQARVWLYLTSDAHRIAGGMPRLFFRGLVHGDPLSEHHTLSLDCNDVLTDDYSLFTDDKPIPRRRINRVPFPGLSDEAENGSLGVPAIYGRNLDVKGINIGPITLNSVSYPACLLWAGHTCKEFEAFRREDGTTIDSGQFGVTIWAPGFTDWTDVNPGNEPYVEIGSEWFALTPLEGELADAVIAGQGIYADIQGIETAGDGTGTLITDLLLQYKHALLNQGLRAYFSGAWLPSETFDYYPDGLTVCLVDTLSFTIANELSKTYNGGTAFQGAFVLGPEGRRSTVRQFISDMNVCCNVSMGWNRYSQLFVRMLNRDRSAFLGTSRTAHWRRDMLKDPARVTTKKRDWLTNVMRVQWAPNHRTSAWDGSDVLADSASQTRYGQEIPNPARVRQYPFIRDEDTALAVAQQQLDFMATAPREFTWAESLCGLRDDLLDGVPVTCYSGPGAAGYVDRAMWITSIALDPRQKRVIKTGFDVDDLLS